MSLIVTMSDQSIGVATLTFAENGSKDRVSGHLVVVVLSFGSIRMAISCAGAVD